MQRIGFIGIGLMGHGMAKNLVKKGHPLTFLVHRNRSNVSDLLDAGAKEASSARELMSGCDVAILCVTGTPQVEANVYGSDGLFAAAKRGQIVIDCATSRPESPDRIRADFEPKGVNFVDAPLARTPLHAEEGKLNCMVGADATTLAAVRPVLEKFCENIFHVGGPGVGHRIKLVSAGGANSNMFQMVVPKALEGDLTGLQFTLGNAAKDIGYYQQMLAGAPMAGAMGAALQQVLVQANALGLGEKFVPSLIEAYGKVNGIQVVKH